MDVVWVSCEACQSEVIHLAQTGGPRFGLSPIRLFSMPQHEYTKASRGKRRTQNKEGSEYGSGQIIISIPKLKTKEPPTKGPSFIGELVLPPGALSLQLAQLESQSRTSSENWQCQSGGQQLPDCNPAHTRSKVRGQVGRRQQEYTCFQNYARFLSREVRGTLF